MNYWKRFVSRIFLLFWGIGSGKSSVVRAGLLYELQQGKRRSGTEQWEILPIIKPGEHPLHSLADAFIEPDVPSKRAERLRKAM
jgi:hypothetical protein